MIVGADNSELSNRKVTVVVPDYIDNTAEFPASNDPGRINQQQVLPSAIQTRLIGNLFSNNPSSEQAGSGIRLEGVIPNNSSGRFTFTLSDNQNRELIATYDIAFYIGEDANDSTQWPNASFGMGNMPFVVYNDWGLTDNRNIVARAVMRNNSGANQNVICYLRFRIIANPGTSSGR